MAAQSHRLLDAFVLQTNLFQPRLDWFDAGAYNQLNIHCRVVTSGTGTLKVQHSATTDEPGFLDLPTVDLSTEGNFTTVNGFLRYVRWVTTGSFSGSPAAVIDLVAKS